MNKEWLKEQIVIMSDLKDKATSEGNSNKSMYFDGRLDQLLFMLSLFFDDDNIEKRG